MAKYQNYEEIRAKIIAKAWKDPAFKKRLLSNPQKTLQEMGYPAHENSKVRVVEDAENTFTFVLPAAPSNISKLSATELQQIAAGKSLHTKGCGGGGSTESSQCSIPVS